MGDFKIFLENGNNGKNDDISQTLKKLPKCHRALLKGYKFKFQNGHSLKGDGEHVGYNDLKKKVICVAAPWRYSRQFTVLHEVAHIVWNSLLSDQQKEQWNKLSKEGCKKFKQNAEEMFCMSYANYYADKPLIDFSERSWKTFIGKLA